MAKPRSITVVHAGLSGAFDKRYPQIPSSGTHNHQGMPCRPRIHARTAPTPEVNASVHVAVCFLHVLTDICVIVCVLSRSLFLCPMTACSDYRTVVLFYVTGSICDSA
jgi:hypothetical protein